ncbi:GNAT family N-acetyltransferase [Amnibacterium endophyticum]|uniref:GNAT family N-acetyltransferase n=1 Tax=Amnibacterium endophyticum TaxID=2109337 RepID=A0ABW4LE33_9MICO
MAEITTEHDADGSRYVALLEGRPIGEARYTDGDGERTFTHTLIDKDQEGNGYGTSLIRAALDDTRGTGLTPVGQCPMVAHFLEKHPEYARPSS